MSTKEHTFEGKNSAIKREAFSSFENYDVRDKLNIIQEEYSALKRLLDNKNIIIHNANRGNSVVLINCCSDVKIIKEVLPNKSNFMSVDI